MTHLTVGKRVTHLCSAVVAHDHGGEEAEGVFFMHLALEEQLEQISQPLAVFLISVKILLHDFFIRSL